MHRTFKDRPYTENDVELNRIKNILEAYAWRNPWVGYCQGFNAIVANLIKFFTEEEAFWVFVQIIENILPIDYYINMLGTLVDQEIFDGLVKVYLPEIAMKFQSTGFVSQLFTLEWFICLFARTL